MSRLVTGLLVCTLALLAGCEEDGPKLFPVTGTVKLDGTPKPQLLVTFTPEKGPAAVGKTNEKGEYILRTNARRGAVEGKHKVTITTINEPTAPSKVQSSAPSGSAEYMNQAAIKPQEFKVPRNRFPISTTRSPSWWAM